MQNLGGKQSELWAIEKERISLLVDLNNMEGQLQFNLSQCGLCITKPETILTG